VDHFKGYQTEARETNRGLWGLKVPSADGNEETSYVLNTNSKVFHRPNCASVGKINPKNRIAYKNRANAVKDGYKPCGNCKP
jgi:Adenosine deaminase